MCFSATASFTMAAGLAAAGAYTLSRAPTPDARLLAAFPLLFSVQQALEGIIWLDLNNTINLSPPGLSLLTSLYLGFAFVIWPAITPWAVWLFESGHTRRRIMLGTAVIGALVSLYLLINLIVHPYLPDAASGHITYLSVINHPVWIELAYAVAVLVPLISSSFRGITVFGIVVWIGAAISYFYYETGRASVWCFFAAAASLILIWHFRQQKRQPI